MIRTILAGGLLALAMIAATEAKACEACAALFKERMRHGGKLVKMPLEAVPPVPGGKAKLPMPAFGGIWFIKTADGKSLALHLGSRTLTRLAAALEGKDVIVTGPLEDGVIDVRDIAAKPVAPVAAL